MWRNGMMTRIQVNRITGPVVDPMQLQDMSKC